VSALRVDADQVQFAGIGLRRTQNMDVKQQRVVEAYYTIGDLAVYLRLSERTVCRKVQEGEFSPGGDLSNIKNLAPKGSRPELRIPASGVNWYLDKHPYSPVTPIKARSQGELRRKAGRFFAVQTFGPKARNGE
jgi:hypothetical protein